MNLLERVLTLLRANINTVVEKSEDPEKVLRQLQLDMRNQLVQVKTQVATAIAEGHKLQKRSRERATEADLWMQKAEQAIQQENDTAARAALSYYNDLTKQVQRYQQQQKEQEQIVTTMRNALRQLEAKIVEVETTIDLLVARKRNALLQQRVLDALNMNGGPKDKERTARAQDAVLEAEARARALADIHLRDLSSQLDQLSEEQLVEQQLHTLKHKSGFKHDPPLLPEAGELQADTLLPPQPSPKTSMRKNANRSKERSVHDVHNQKELDLMHLKKLVEEHQNEEV